MRITASTLDVLGAILQRARPRAPSYTVILRRLGPVGLFLMAVIDSTPVPTLGGADILNVIFCARHREPWYYYAAAATLGSVIGAYITFRLARGAGSAFLER